jgi:hypothetical protein
MHKDRKLHSTKSWSARSSRANPNVPDWAVTDRCLAATSSTVWLCGLHADMLVMSPMHAEHAGQWILFIHGFKWITRPIDTATGRRQVEDWKLVSRYSCYVMGNTSHNLSQTSIKRTNRLHCPRDDAHNLGQLKKLELQVPISLQAWKYFLVLTRVRNELLQKKNVAISLAMYVRMSLNM